MPKRELRTYLYTCDGYLTDGAKCFEERSIEAVTPNDADLAITDPRPMNEPWQFTTQGWICNRTHRA